MRSFSRISGALGLLRIALAIVVTAAAVIVALPALVLVLIAILLLPSVTSVWLASLAKWKNTKTTEVETRMPPSGTMN